MQMQMLAISDYMGAIAWFTIRRCRQCGRYMVYIDPRSLLGYTF